MVSVGRGVEQQGPVVNQPGADFLNAEQVAPLVRHVGVVGGVRLQPFLLRYKVQHIDYVAVDVSGAFGQVAYANRAQRPTYAILARHTGIG